MMTLDETVSLYQRPPLSEFGGASMVQFLSACRDLLGVGNLFFSVSHSTLWVTKHRDQPDEHPGIRIWTDGSMFELVYQESWRDGSFFRTREEHIRCSMEHVHTALAELLHRLKPSP